MGLCLANLDAKVLERGVVAALGSVRPALAAVALVRKVGALFGMGHFKRQAKYVLSSGLELCRSIFFIMSICLTPIAPIWSVVVNFEAITAVGP